MITLDSTIPTQFVFWSYAHYPFVLGAIGAPRPNGMWYVNSYQMTVKPLAVFEPPLGQAIRNSLDKLQTERLAAFEALEAGFLVKARAVAPFIPIEKVSA